MSQTIKLSYLQSLQLSEERVEEIMEQLSEDSEFLYDETFPLVYVILDNMVLDLKAFLLKHPGSPHPILQYIGKDATTVFQSLHSGRAKQHAKQFIIGTVLNDVDQ